MGSRRIIVSSGDQSHDEGSFDIETTFVMPAIVADAISDEDWQYLKRCIEEDGHVTLAETVAFLTKRYRLGAKKGAQ